jgi:hypothetical protein
MKCDLDCHAVVLSDASVSDRETAGADAGHRTVYGVPDRHASHPQEPDSDHCQYKIYTPDDAEGVPDPGGRFLSLPSARYSAYIHVAGLVIIDITSNDHANAAKPLHKTPQELQGVREF